MRRELGRSFRLSLSGDQYEDLTNALEDHRDDFKGRAEQAQFGLGLDPASWTTRAGEVQQLLDMIRRLASEGQLTPSREQDEGSGRNTDPRKRS